MVSCMYIFHHCTLRFEGNKYIIIIYYYYYYNGIVAPVADVISMGRCYIQHTYTIQSIVFRKKNIGQWNAKSGPKAAYGNFAMRKKNSGSLKKK